MERGEAWRGAAVLGAMRQGMELGLAGLGKPGRGVARIMVRRGAALQGVARRGGVRYGVE